MKPRSVSQVRSGIRKRVAIYCLRWIVFLFSAINIAKLAQTTRHACPVPLKRSKLLVRRTKITSILAPPIFVFLDYGNDERLRCLACLLGLLNSMIDFVNVMLVSVVSGVRAWFIRLYIRVFSLVYRLSGFYHRMNLRDF